MTRFHRLHIGDEEGIQVSARTDALIIVFRRALDWADRAVAAQVCKVLDHAFKWS